MKKSIRTIALCALFAISLGASAQQRSYEVPELKEELKMQADNINTLQMEDPEKANKEYTKLMKKIQKNKEDLVAVGTYFLEGGNIPAVKQCAEKVYALDYEYIPGLMFSAEYYMKIRKYDMAGQRFDAVLQIDPDNIGALRRNAFVYKNINPFVAVEALEHILTIAPDDYASHKELGDIYFNMDEYVKSAEQYDAYYKSVPKDAENLDINSCDKYLMALYSTAATTAGQWAKIISIIDEIQPLAPEDMMIKRMRFFSNVNAIGEAFDIDAAVAKAEQSMDYVAKKEYADTAYLSLDYEYVAALYKEKGDYAQVVDAYKKALERDEKKVTLYKDLAMAYRSDKQGDQAIATYRIYLQKLGDKASIRDRFLLGTMLESAASSEQDAAKKEEYIKEGDAAFVDVLEHQPDYWQAVQHRAVINIRNSAEAEDLPKQYFEQALSMMPADEQYNSQRLSANQYLAFYYIMKDDLDNARKYVDIMLGIDPEFATAVQMDTYLKQNNK